jgi:hypothetical protein
VVEDAELVIGDYESQKEIPTTSGGVENFVDMKDRTSSHHSQTSEESTTNKSSNDRRKRAKQ